MKGIDLIECEHRDLRGFTLSDTDEYRYSITEKGQQYLSWLKQKQKAMHNCSPITEFEYPAK